MSSSSRTRGADSSSPVLVFLDVEIGDQALFQSQREMYQRAQSFLQQEGSKFSLPSSLEVAIPQSHHSRSPFSLCLWPWACT